MCSRVPARGRAIARGYVKCRSDLLHPYHFEGTQTEVDAQLEQFKRGIMAKKPILCIDFDGVIFDYKGWKGADVVDGLPVPGAMAAIVELSEHFEVHVFSSRSNQPGGIRAMQTSIYRWMREHFEETKDAEHAELMAFAIVYEHDTAIKFPDYKPPALVMIDDRALTFDGDWANYTTEKLREFRPWNKL